MPEKHHKCVENSSLESVVDLDQ